MPRKLCIFTERGPLIALAIAAGMVLGIVGPTSAQFFNFGGYQQRQQPQRGGGGFGGGWFGNDMYGAFQQHGPPASAANATARARGFFKGTAAREARDCA